MSPATPLRRLPGTLPEGERVLWQGRPDWKTLFASAFHGRILGFYFGTLLLIRGAVPIASGDSPVRALEAMLWLLPPAGLALGLLALIAWLSARQTCYTITSHRVIMRVGIVLEITFNLPFCAIESAGLRLYGNGRGDLPLMLGRDDRIAYLNLWPHVRPWHLKRPMPMLRAVPEAAEVGALLSRALGGPGLTLPAPSQAPSRGQRANPTSAVPAAPFAS